MAFSLPSPSREFRCLKQMLKDAFPHLDWEEGSAAFVNAAVNDAIQNVNQLHTGQLFLLMRQLSIRDKDSALLLLCFFSMFNIAVIRPKDEDVKPAQARVLNKLMDDVRTLTSNLGCSLSVLNFNIEDRVGNDLFEGINQTHGGKPKVVYILADEAPHRFSRELQKQERKKGPLVVVVGDLDAHRDLNCDEPNPGWAEYIQQNEENRMVRICHNSLAYFPQAAEIENEVSGDKTEKYHGLRILLGFARDLIETARQTQAQLTTTN